LIFLIGSIAALRSNLKNPELIWQTPNRVQAAQAPVTAILNVSYVNSYFQTYLGYGGPNGNNQQMLMTIDSGSCELVATSTLCTNCLQNLAQPLYNPTTSSTFNNTYSFKKTQYNATNPQAVTLCYGAGTSCQSGTISQDTISLPNGNGNATSYPITSWMQVLTSSMSPSAQTGGIWGVCSNYTNYISTYNASNNIPSFVAAMGGSSNSYALWMDYTTNKGNLTIGGWNNSTFPMTNSNWFPINPNIFYWQVPFTALNGIPINVTNFYLTVDTGAPGITVPTYYLNNVNFTNSLSVTPGVCAWNATATQYVYCNCANASQLNPLTYTMTNLNGVSVTYSLPPSVWASFNSKGACSGQTLIHYTDADAKWGQPNMLHHYMVFNYDLKAVGIFPLTATNKK